MNTHFRTLAAVAGAALLLPGLAGHAASPAGQRARDGAAAARSPWLAVSDLHFNPFAGATTRTVDRLAVTPAARWGRVLERVSRVPSGYGNDTNYALLASALRSMRKEVPHPPVVVISGDFLAHSFRQQYDSLATDHSEEAYRAFVGRTVAFLASFFNRSFSRAQFVATPGNNDSICGDYEMTPRDSFLQSFAAAWRPLVDRYGRAPGFAATFSRLGGYQARLPIAGSRAVVVNSIFWSLGYRNACGQPAQHPAPRELRWLVAATRRLPPNGRNWLVTHIPPGIDVFSSQDQAPVPFLQPADQAGLLKALSSRAWALEIAGHIHMSTYLLARRTPVMVVPSISPIFSNNPAYYRLLVTRTGQVANFTAFHFRMKAGAWAREYTFNRAYGVHGFSAASLAVLQRKLSRNPVLRAEYMQFYNSGSGIDGITPATFHSYWCGAIALTAPTYTACLKHT